MADVSLIALLLVLIVALALLSPVFAVLFVKSARRHHWKAPAWLKTLFQILRAANAVVSVGSFVALLVMVIWLVAHSK